jgi:hypothetical protein
MSYLLNYKKGARDSQPQVIKVYQLLSKGRWFSPGTPVSSTTKTGRHDIAEILLNTKIQIQNSYLCCFCLFACSGVRHDFTI